MRKRAHQCTSLRGLFLLLAGAVIVSTLIGWSEEIRSYLHEGIYVSSSPASKIKSEAFEAAPASALPASDPSKRPAGQMDTPDFFRNPAPFDAFEAAPWKTPAVSSKLVVTARPQVTPSPQHFEQICAEKCKKMSYCCNDIRQGSNMLLSCAQACMVRARGTSRSACSELCGQSRCTFDINGFSYPSCHVCDDLTGAKQCNSGVANEIACEDGCDLNPRGEESALLSASAAPQPKRVDEGFTFGRMRWWTLSTGDLPTIADKYVLFDNDAGGPNNMRIGWEMTGIVARATGRTFVLPPAAKMYLLDFGPMNEHHRMGVAGVTKTRVEDLIQLSQLRSVMPTLTREEFEQRTGVRWRTAVREAEQVALWSVCLLSEYKRVQARFLFMQGDNPRREGFSCGEWPKLGGPKGQMRPGLEEADWALLTHGFVWHTDAFRIASIMVEHLGIFKYLALHARYNDFQFKEDRQPSDVIMEKLLKTELFSLSKTLYVASDEPEKFSGGLLQEHGIRVVTFDSLLKVGPVAHPLAVLRKKLGPERWFKMLGPAEELVCVFASVFVGSRSSTFTGHIQRMRIHAGAPSKAVLHHTNTDINVFDEAVEEVRKAEKQAQPFSPMSLDKGDRF